MDRPSPPAHVSAPHAAYHRWRSTEADIRRLIRENRDDDAARLLVTAGLLPGCARIEVAHVREGMGLPARAR